MHNPATRILACLALPLLLVACAPHHLLIERGEIDHLEQRFSEWDQRLDQLEQRHDATHERLALRQGMADAAMMQAMLAGFERQACGPAPMPVCLVKHKQADEDGEADESSARSDAPFVRVDDKQLVGGVEQVLLAPPGLLLEARIDTGAESASLDARDMQEFERDGQTWVRFSIMDRETEELFEIERRVVRHVRILQSSTEDAERRPVVEFRLTLGDFSQTAEFTLSDRSHLSFPVLIGRNVLQDVMLVDVGQSHIAPPRIPVPESSASR